MKELSENLLMDMVFSTMLLVTGIIIMSLTIFAFGKIKRTCTRTSIFRKFRILLGLGTALVVFGAYSIYCMGYSGCNCHTLKTTTTKASTKKSSGLWGERRKETQTTLTSTYATRSYTYYMVPTALIAFTIIVLSSSLLSDHKEENDDWEECGGKTVYNTSMAMTIVSSIVLMFLIGITVTLLRKKKKK
jgi:hypothetical protein